MNNIIIIFQIILNQAKDKTLLEAGLNFEPKAKNIILIKPSKKETKIEISVETSPSNEVYSDDDLLLGASASPTEMDTSSPANIPIPPVLPLPYDCDPITTSDYKNSKKLDSIKLTRTHSNEAGSSRGGFGYVGLVNQAMTCYLNSLLQALFMTPEFRQALYNWEYDGIDDLKSIPYQLQKLFLNLQVSCITIEKFNLN